jgi:hypothetical protein
MGTGGFSPGSRSDRDMKLATQFYLQPMSRMVELYLHYPIHLHGIVLNKLSIGTPLPFKSPRLHYCLCAWAPRHDDVWGSWAKAPRIRHIGTRERWAICFTFRWIYLWGKIPRRPLLGGWMRSTVGLGAVEKKNNYDLSMDLTQVFQPVTNLLLSLSKVRISWD